MTSFGDSGLPVAHAGHWSWQRPHSVHVEKSSRPFQVKSSMAPTPRRASSGRSSSAARSTGAPSIVIGWSGPSATPPRGSRRAYTLTTARNRCHATPIVGCRPTTTNHDIDTTIFTVATTTIAFSSVAGATPIHDAPNQAVSGKCHASPEYSAYSSPRSTITHSTTASTVASTKNACPWFDPKNREPRSREPSRSRSTISARMPTSDSHAIASIAHSSGGKCPISGSANAGSTTCPYPVTRVRNSSANETITTQCATLTTGRCWNRPCPSTSRVSVASRGPTGVHRPPAARPTRTVRTISRAPRANMATPTTVATTTITRHTTCSASTPPR